MSIFSSTKVKFERKMKKKVRGGRGVFYISSDPSLLQYFLMMMQKPGASLNDHRCESVITST